ncbi:MAG: UDP-N-acetylmuramate:L-alanyl-gamma-D-glutamyl-meso-diaminopimelate ligase [Pseudomonadales bacterium]|nr:MAG: UDP-N-acetylmuramate:L-alanyl-gamma-D-glutamyl-meso-diaminopimelate ligase [Pseudomonadales bacterium]
MHIHILGICGTFMGSLALLARELGYKVTGVDAQVYPPMSTQLEQAGIALLEGYANHGLESLHPDVVVIGNAMSRGNPAVEYVLDNKLPYQSGPGFIADHVLAGRKVLAVSGTHGKTTTSSMLAWILECAGYQPGFLIGGVPQDFGQSARLGSGECFVIEADEYDSAFFDKRSKFVHYRPDTLVINNLEFDHADIFADLAAIQKQFHHVVRTVPGCGHVLAPDEDNVQAVLKQGLWSNLHYLSGSNSEWQVLDANQDQTRFRLLHVPTGSAGVVDWDSCGEHNVANATAAVAAAVCSGVGVEQAVTALNSFQGVKRRMELVGEAAGVSVYDDFAHHPTAIRLTLQAAKRRFPDARVIAVVEPRSNTMRMGVHDSQIGQALSDADAIWWSADAEGSAIFNNFPGNRLPTIHVELSPQKIASQVGAFVKSGDVVIVMSNGGFGGINQLLLNAIGKR